MSSISSTAGWVLVDTGIPLSWSYILAAVHRRYGPNAKPKAIILTHGHFDHSGNAKHLAELWNVQIYASRLEMPYLSGRCDYPAQDPTPGGAISFLSRTFPTHSIKLGPHLAELPDQGSFDVIPGWTIIPTPGHSAGHISLFRESDSTLLVGDAFLTADFDQWSSHFTWPRALSRPPTPLTPDWKSAGESIQRLAALRPTVVAAGHGLPMDDADLPEQLQRFADTMQKPREGRYANAAPVYDETGAVVSLPPATADPVGTQLKVGGLAAVAMVATFLGSRGKKLNRHASDSQ